MANVLVVFGSPKFEEASSSSKLARHFINKYQEVNPEHTITEVNPTQLDNFGLTATILAGEPTAEDLERIAIRQDILAKLKAADKVVIATPMWDYAIPGSLKEYLDAFCVSKETFEYLSEPDENGNIQRGLLGDKKALFIQSMGGFNANAEDDLSHKIVSKILGFIGIEDQTYIAAEGVDVPGHSSFDNAAAAVISLAEAF